MEDAHKKQPAEPVTSPTLREAIDGGFTSRAEAGMRIIERELGLPTRSIAEHVAPCPACEAENERLRSAGKVLAAVIRSHVPILTPTTLRALAVMEGGADGGRHA